MLEGVNKVTMLFLVVAITTAEADVQLTSNDSQPASAVSATTADGVTIYGEFYAGDLDADSPLVLLFHQGGSNGRGEYGAHIAPWLNEAGYRAIAWDLRAGGDRLGSTNRTVADLDADTPAGYCAAAADIEAALDYAIESGLGERVVLWGSSFSGALVFEAAAQRPESVSGVIAFSPASGGPLKSCRARMWVEDVTVPMLVVRPAAEMEHASSKEQRDILAGAGVDFHVVENGVHGSSMLVDERTDHDMRTARAAVADWLARVTGAGN